jgi:glycosyltransferase involved in cell wall biosynthesis
MIKNVLMICSTFPYPPTRGGTQGRTFNLLKTVTQNCAVTLITQQSEDVSNDEISQLRHFVNDLVIFPRPTIAKAGIAAKIQRFGQFFLGGTPPNVLFLYSEEIQKWIDNAVAAGKFATITCEHSVNEVYIRPEWKKQLRTVINIHSSVYRTCKNQLETGTSDNEIRDRLYLPLLRRYEQQTVRKFSRVVVTTDEDEQQMKAFVPDADVLLIPNGVDLETFPYRPTDPGGHNLVFVGGLDYFVNIDAACFFSTEVLPFLQQKYPDATLTLVGSKPSPEVQALAKRPGITVTGRVPSVAAYLHKATVAVIPLRTGFGMKFKTLESMAAGVPVVASDRGLEGMEVDSSNVPLRALRANRVEEYVEAIGRLFEDAQLRETLSRHGRELIEQEYTWERLGEQYERAIAEV